MTIDLPAFSFEGDTEAAIDALEAWLRGLDTEQLLVALGLVTWLELRIRDDLKGGQR